MVGNLEEAARNLEIVRRLKAARQGDCPPTARILDERESRSVAKRGLALIHGTDGKAAGLGATATGRLGRVRPVSAPSLGLPQSASPPPSRWSPPTGRAQDRLAPCRCRPLVAPTAAPGPRSGPDTLPRSCSPCCHMSLYFVEMTRVLVGFVWC